MNLYCVKCGRNHAFSNGEVERIVYCLLAMQADHWMVQPEWKPEKIDDAMYCWREYLSASRDPEEYAEWTAALVDSRRDDAANARK